MDDGKSTIEVDDDRSTAEDHVSASVVGTVTLRLDQGDRSTFADEVAERVTDRIVDIIEQRFSGRTGEGVQVLSVPEVARSLGKTERQLRRLEKQGSLPSRRQISARRVAYYAHEIQKVPVSLVRVRDYRRLNQDELATKIGLGRATIKRMVRKGDLPPTFDGRHWYERDIDSWLLSRPQVQD